MKTEKLDLFKQKVNLNRACKLVYGMHLHAIWNHCDYYGKQRLQWSFLDRRQVFFEVVAYYLEQKKIKFGGTIVFVEEQLEWDENTSIEDTIAYLEKGFCKDEELFLNGNTRITEIFKNININSDDWINKVIKYPIEYFEMSMYSYFFKYCPLLAYWDDKDNSWYWTS